jgi:hypothetical protein
MKDGVGLGSPSFNRSRRETLGYLPYGVGLEWVYALNLRGIHETNAPERSNGIEHSFVAFVAPEMPDFDGQSTAEISPNET